MTDLDDIDKRILNALQRDADRSNADIAEEVGLSASACLRRTAKLKKAGIIKKVVAVVDPKVTGQPLTAIVTVEFAHHGSEYRQAFKSQVMKEPAISQCYIVTGDVSCILVAHVKDMDDYTELADRLFDQDKNVSAFYTHMVMQQVKNSY